MANYRSSFHKVVNVLSSHLKKIFLRLYISKSVQLSFIKNIAIKNKCSFTNYYEEPATTQEYGGHDICYNPSLEKKKREKKRSEIRHQIIL